MVLRVTAHGVLVEAVRWGVLLSSVLKPTLGLGYMDFLGVECGSISGSSLSLPGIDALLWLLYGATWGKALAPSQASIPSS